MAETARRPLRPWNTGEPTPTSADRQCGARGEEALSRAPPACCPWPPPFPVFRGSGSPSHQVAVL
jgi:hypothetical protein